MITSVPRPTGAPQESDYKALTVRIPRELVECIQAMARDEQRSLNFIAARLLREALDNRDRNDQERPRATD
jgi:predicted HicB family RNase H-like nuclease